MKSEIKREEKGSIFEVGKLLESNAKIVYIIAAYDYPNVSGICLSGKHIGKVFDSMNHDNFEPFVGSITLTQD